MAEQQRLADEARQAAVDLKAEEDAERIRKYHIWQDKETEEQPGILKTSELLFIKLRKEGIVGILEDFTDTNIETPFIVLPEDRVHYTESEATSREKRRDRQLRSLFNYSDNWKVEFLRPYLDQESLTWVGANQLDLSLQRHFYSPRFGANRPKIIRSEYIDISYDGSWLKILGNPDSNPCFDDKLPRNKEERVELVENSLLKGLKDPRIVVPKQEIRTPHYELPVVIG